MSDAITIRAFDISTKTALAGRLGRPWRYDDCALFCADIIQSVMGYDPARDWRGRYADEAEMCRLLGKKGLPGAVHRALTNHGWRLIAPQDCIAGDIGLVPALRGPTAVIRHGVLFVGAVDRGFATGSAAEVARAWTWRN